MLCIIAYLFLGPESLIFQNHLYYVIIGLFICGLGLAFSLIPTIPRFIQISFFIDINFLNKKILK